jgi:hypothetical protein
VLYASMYSRAIKTGEVLRWQPSPTPPPR